QKANAISGHFKAIVESSDEAIISKDLNGIIKTWNQGAERTFGYTAAEAIGKPVTILIPPDHIDEEPGILARLRVGQRIDHYETVRVRKDGQLIDISLTVSPIKDQTGRIAGASKIARDISARKRAERELEQARDEAERANRAKDDFLAALSHELRTPLNPVLLLASDAASNPDLPPGIRANFDTILKNVELEAKLIDDLLDLARVRSGKLRVEKNYVNLHSVLAAALSIVKIEMDHKKIVLKQKLPDTQIVVLGDTVRLQQIFWNVLKNAIKFTAIGGIITIETSSSADSCAVTISDTGIGMSPEELGRVFDAFKQGDHSMESHRFGGLGLGLTISKKLVELHSGSIEAASDGLGKGSRFTIALPLAEWNGREAGNTVPHRINHHGNSGALQILLVDDHEPTRSALAKLLANRLHKVMVAGSVGEAMAVCKNTHFDLLISDIGLPDGSGYDLFDRVRRQTPGAKGIALTGYGMERDMQRSKDKGFCAHLTKPVKVDALDAALTSIVNVQLETSKH
ncbi:MAG: PAS domain-containing hybrid sensor histidine kinase/response regulator, partial [Limisphaerales bacterium]